MKLNKKYWDSLSENQQRKIIDNVKTIVTALSIIIATIFGFTSCQVIRTITNEATSYNKGDTSVVIQTKTIESYTATKKQ